MYNSISKNFRLFMKIVTICLFIHGPKEPHIVFNQLVVSKLVMGSQQAATEMAGGASPRAHTEQYRVNSTRQIRLDGFGLLGKE